MNKKFIKLIFLLLMLVNIAGCTESEEDKRNSIDVLASQLTEPDSVKYYESTLKQYEKEEYLIECLSNKIAELSKNEEYEKVINIIKNLQDVAFSKEIIINLEDIAKKSIEEKVKEYAASSDIGAFITYLAEMNNYSKYIDLKDSSVGNVLYYYAKEYGTKIITQDELGGYYDEKKNQYKEKIGRWYDPLSKKYVNKGEIGTYRNNVSYDFYGDILHIVKQEEWWSPNGINSATNYTHTYEYKGIGILPGDYATYITKAEAYELVPKNVKETMYFVSTNSNNVYLLVGDGVIEYHK